MERIKFDTGEGAVEWADETTQRRKVKKRGTYNFCVRRYKMASIRGEVFPEKRSGALLSNKA